MYFLCSPAWAGTYIFSLYILGKHIFIEKRKTTPLRGNRLGNKKEKEQIGKNARLIGTIRDSLDPR